MKPQVAQPPPLPTTPNRRDDSIFQLLELQQKLKNPTVAALLAMFFPFIGTFYASALTGVVSTGLGWFFTWVYFDQSAPIWLIFLSVNYLVSIFSALKRVKLYNARIIAEAKNGAN